ncbi:MAG: hypothetical protein M1829_005020 [Trizodia sp. TS-e1964]|nr:MAG: hypothetical protein M1829_005020 [Trizodia sp. TS-e1964]
MATVFLMQAIGQLAATLVSMAVVAGVQRQNLPPDAAIDTVWRWVIGVGAIPGVFAILFRLLIPESPRYILDVQQKMDKAGYAATFFGGPLIDDEDDLDEDDGRSMVSEQGNPAHTFLGNRHVFPGNNSQNESANPSANGDLEILPSEYTSQSAVSVYGQEPKKPAIQPSDVPVEPFSKASRADIYTFFIEERNIHYLLGTAGAWFVLDFAFFGLGMNNPQTIAKVWNADHSNSTTPYTWYTETDPNMSIFEVLNNNGLRSLVVVSVGSVLGAIIVIFAIDRFNRKNLQMYGFLILGVLLIVIGATFHVVIQTNFHGVTITLYVLCQFFFNLGPNTLTFIIPAEIFPTRYRCTCHGLSAAAGKLGSVIVQIFLSYVSFNGEGSLSPNSKWLGYVLLVFGFLMFSGAAITLLIPQTQHVAQVNGRYQNLTLEELAKGKARLKPAAAHPVERVS